MFKELKLIFMVMKGINILLIQLILSILFASSLQAKTYYCLPDKGKIENPGTKELPLPSLQKVLSSEFKLLPGDTLLLMSGNHGTPELKGINTNYIYIFAAPNQKPVITHLDIAKTAATTKWHLKSITFLDEKYTHKELISFYKKSMFITIEQCYFFSEKNTDSWSIEDWKTKLQKGIKLEGSRHKIENNTFTNISTGISVNANNCTINGNKISSFTNFGILCLGNNNIFTYNLIKNLVYTGFNAAAFKADNTKQAISKSNILLGNVIIDYTDYKMEHLAPLMGIVGFEGNYTNWIIENNLVVTDHWHGISFQGISNSLIINNTVIDPYLDTKYPNLDKENQSKSFGPVRIWVSESDKGVKSINNRVVNNLASDYLLADSIGLISNNLKVRSSYSEMDEYFEKWDYLNFHLKDSSLAINAGNLQYAPKIDADGTKRPLGKTVNVGAYEYSYIQSGDQKLNIVAEQSDQELRSNNKKADWLGQPLIRIGGTGANFDGVMVIPFALPPLPDGFVIKSAKFKVNLEKIDNSPKGSINLHGLIARKSPNVLQTDYYQGDIMGDMNARPIQQDFLGKLKGGKVETSKEGNAILADYLNSIYQSGAMGGDYVFLRLSPSSKDVEDYHRWVFSSANSDDFDKRPVLEVLIGRLDDNIEQQTLPKTIIVSPDILNDGNFSVNLIGFETKDIPFKIVGKNKVVYYKGSIKNKDNDTKNWKSNGKLRLKPGTYYLRTENISQRFIVW